MLCTAVYIIFNKIRIIDHLYLLAGENERNIIHKMQLQLHSTSPPSPAKRDVE